MLVSEQLVLAAHLKALLTSAPQQSTRQRIQSTHSPASWLLFSCGTRCRATYAQATSVAASCAARRASLQHSQTGTLEGSPGSLSLAVSDLQTRANRLHTWPLPERVHKAAKPTDWRWGSKALALPCSGAGFAEGFVLVDLATGDCTLCGSGSLLGDWSGAQYPHLLARTAALELSQSTLQATRATPPP